MTDTAKYADVILPAVTFLEQQEIKSSYGSYALQYINPVIKPRGESKPNEEVFALLGRRMGWKDNAFMEKTDDYLKRAVNAVKGLGKEVDFKKLQNDKIAFFDFPGKNPVQFSTVFPFTNDKKINLSPKNLGIDPFRYFELSHRDFPLAMLSPATNKTVTSTMGEYNLAELYIEINPKDAKPRAIKEGSLVRVFNKLGEVIVKARITEKVRDGVVVIPKGAWRKSSLNGCTSTALTPDTLSRIGAGACFNDSRVEIKLVQ